MSPVSLCGESGAPSAKTSRTPIRTLHGQRGLGTTAEFLAPAWGRALITAISSGPGRTARNSGANMLPQFRLAGGRPVSLVRLPEPGDQPAQRGQHLAFLAD